MNKRGFAGLLYLILSVVIGIILVMVVAVPVTKTSITAAGLNGTDATIASTITTFLVIGGLVLAAGVSIYGFTGSHE